jgi:DNA-directed RNA polymerase specialized sigma24 family protein
MSEEMTERGQWIAGHILPWESQVRGWFRRIVPRGLEVDDVIQEAYAIFSSLADVSRIGSPRAYFYQVVRSLSTNQLSVELNGATHVAYDDPGFSTHDAAVGISKHTWTVQAYGEHQRYAGQSVLFL